MKKFMAIVMCLAMALSMMTVVSFAAEKATISISSKTAAPGETVSVDLIIADNPGIAALNTWFEYDKSVLTLTDIAAGTQMGTPTPNVGGACIFWFGTANSTYNGVIATLTFKVADDAADGNYAVTPAYDYNNDDVVNDDYDALEVNMVAGAITVKAPVTEPTVAETFVDTESVDGQPAYLCVLQPKNAKACGIKYVGANEKYNGKVFYAYADENGTFATTTAAVKVIGLDNAFEAYAE